MSGEVQEFIAELRPPVRKVALAARALVLASLSEAQEKVDFGNRLLVYQIPLGDSLLPVCEIHPCRDHVDLLFYQGVRLEDPERLLAGTGPACRQVRLETEEDAGRSGVQSLVGGAAVLARSLMQSQAV
jgi:hypothetical protein